MKPISTKAHGAIDYMTAGLLLGLPEVVPMSGRIKRLLRLAALWTAGYSALTNYEFGLTKTLPMQEHLKLDRISGLLMVLAPFVLRPRSDTVKSLLLGIGMFELAVTMASEEEPGPKFDFSEDVLPRMSNGTRRDRMPSPN